MDGDEGLMELRITHVTGFEYDGLVSASYNEARMTPLSDAAQTVRHARIDVDPQPWSTSYVDYWGATVTAFEVLDPHRELTVTATSTVRTTPARELAVQTTWEELADPVVRNDLAEFLAVTDRVRAPEDLAEAIRGLVADGASPGAVAREVCRLVQSEMAYEPGATDVHARAAEAWDLRSGVCQDFAHLVIGALRGVGVPCRYVSGYLLPRADAQVGEVTYGESHAWMQWWDHGWQSFDPTNDRPPGEHHVTVASGRDYTDVRPLSGIYTGAATSRMFVDVQVTRLA